MTQLPQHADRPSSLSAHRQTQPHKISELAPGLFLIEGAVNLGIALTNEGVVLIDTGLPAEADALLACLRQITQKPVRYIIYTHGHADHAANARPFLAEAEQRGDIRPVIIAHESVIARIKRYTHLHGQQEFLNRIQLRVPSHLPAFPPIDSFVYPDITYKQDLTFRLSDLTFDLWHALGETDDMTWVFLPERRAIFSGDLVTPGIPNIGNPFKVQRYEVEWADALERMVALHPQVLGPGHGSALYSEATITDSLLTTVKALRYLHDEVVRRLNQGQWEEQIVSEVRLPAELAAHPALASIYGSPSFIVHAIYRRYSGWYDGNPSHLSPSRTSEIATELLMLSGADALLGRARQLVEAGNDQLALHLLDVIIDADKSEAEIRERALIAKAESLQRQATLESSFISKSIFGTSAKRIMKQFTHTS